MPTTFIWYILIIFARVQGEIYWRMDGKKLNATPIDTSSIKTPENCIGMCLFDERCKSFDVLHDKCNLYDLDRCAPWVRLVDERETTYFDLVAEDNQCTTTSKVIILHNVLSHFFHFFVA